MNLINGVMSADYDTVELRGGRLHKIHLSEARVLGKEDRMVPVAKCYCRSHDVITAADAELQRRPTFVFPAQFFKNLESLIGKELEGRIYSDTRGRRVKFYLDLKEHAGFQLEEGDHNLQSPWYDESCIKE
ncbi:MAG TPA: SAF domain-containing protein [Bryobacteraceae bacterium]|nr:SAF domain-containing protein [Bryobacteraceae bacterium]